jgi:hypothetical protein
MSRKALLVCGVLASVACALVHAEPVVPAKLPADVIALVEVGNLNDAIGKVAGLVGQVEPQVGMMIPAQAAMIPPGLCKTQNAASVDMAKPLRLFVLAPTLGTRPVLTFGLTNADAYLNGILLQKQASVGDVHTYEQMGEKFCVAIVGRRAVTGEDEATVKKVAEMVTSGAFGDTPLLAGGDAGAVLRVQKLMDELRLAGQDPFEKARMGMQGFPPHARGMLEAYVTTAESVVAQVDAVALRLSFAHDALVVSEQVQPAPGSGLAGYFAGVGKGSPALVKYMPADAVLFVAAKAGDIKPLMEWYSNVLGTMMAMSSQMAPAAGQPDPAAMVEELSTMMRKSAEAFGGEVAWAVAPGPAGGFSFATATSVGDMAKMKELMASVPEMTKNMGALMAASGMKMDILAKENALTHSGVSITEWEYTIEFQPQPGVPPQAAAVQNATMDVLFGKEKKVYSGFHNGVLLQGQGEASLAALMAMIDGKNRLPGSATLKEAMTGMPAEPVVLGYANVTALGNQFMAMLIQAQLPGVAPMLEGKRLADAPPVGFAVTISADGTVSSRTRMPVAIAKSIWDLVKEIRMEIEAGMQPPPGQHAPPPDAF